MLERSRVCGTSEDSSVPGYIGLVESPEEFDKDVEDGNIPLWQVLDEKRKDLSTKLTKHIIDHRVYKDYQISFKNKKFDDFCFAYDGGCSATLFIADGEGWIVDDCHPDWRHDFMLSKFIYKERK